MLKNTPLIILLLSFYMHVSAQNESITAETDTIIVVNKELARRIVEDYGYSEQLKNDLIPDYSKEWMVTDRPHVAETPILTPKSVLQIETGFQFQKSKTTSYKTNDLTYNTMLLRLGLSRRVEARFQLDYLGSKTQKRSNDSLVSNENGFSGLSVGSKVFLFNERGIVPKGTLLYWVSLPFFGSKNFRTPYTTASEIEFLFLNEITKFYELEYNVGLQWGGTTKNADYAYAINNEFSINRKFHFFVELYGYFYENSSTDNRFNGKYTNDHRVNGGIWYLFNKDLQFDLSGGMGLSKISPNYYFSVGLSNRLALKKKEETKGD
ncbi:MAG TPA: transporter [Cytophagaceae bacterium]|jgi:hypothetical protein|nr:transporter [Cytophagaceae bacterium]